MNGWPGPYVGNLLAVDELPDPQHNAPSDLAAVPDCEGAPDLDHLGPPITSPEIKVFVTREHVDEGYVSVGREPKTAVGSASSSSMRAISDFTF